MANNDTPESEFSIECFQNYSAGEVFVQGLAGIVDQTDVQSLIRAQKTMLQRFEKTTEMLTNCNALSAARLKVALQEFRRHTQLLLDMKKDLEHIFKKIRLIKTKLSQQYPEAYKVAVAASFSSRMPINEKEPVTNSDAVTAPTASTETLRPTSETKIKINDGGDKMADNRNEMADDADYDKNAGVEKRHSSSSETEGKDSSRGSSTDTG